MILLIYLRALLDEAVRILGKIPQEHNLRRIARSKYKLSCVLEDLNDPRARDVRSEAHALRMMLSPSDAVDQEPDNESLYDALVAYI